MFLIKRLLILIFIALLVALISFTVFKIYKNTNSDTTLISPLPPGQTTATIPTPTLPTHLSSNLGEKVEEALTGTRGTYGIAIKNLKTGEFYYAHEQKIFEAASLYKLWIMATAYDQIEKGTLKEDQTMSQDIKVLNEKFKIATESAETTEGKITLSVQDALEQMITISHNDAALLLSEKVRLKNVTTFLKENSFTKSSLGEPPKTTAYDIALFFEKLYNRNLANPESTNIMLDLLKKQTLNHKLPKYLPKSTIIAHKTGEIGPFTHDAGIAYTPNGDYIIAVLSESNSPRAAEERIANISQAVFDYFSKKQ
ncbi:MAG: serine hydrolase [Candidatus Levybacteria bacterium]|nr:serine hydrolase [Candidatus Levybacteria bacterium]